MSRFIVHGIPGSPYVRTVLLALEEKGADWQLAAMGFGDHKKPPHLEKHPFGRIPVLDHGDFRLYETHAILRYIDRTLPSPSLTPADSRAEARMDQIISLTDAYVRTDVSGAIGFPLVVAPRLGIEVDTSPVAAALPAARTCIGELARLLGDQAYLAGERLSLADLMVAPHLAFLPGCAEGRAMLGSHPALARWLAHMEERPSMARTGWDRLLEDVKLAA